MRISKWMIGLIVLSIIGTGILYPFLPDYVPSHWNISGEIDDYQPKLFVFFTALLPFLVYMLMVFLPKIDPKREAYQKHQKAYQAAATILSLFLIFIHWITLTAALGYPVDVGMMVRLGVAVLFVVLGNYLGQVRQNYFFGIKTPWTLANEQVWKKTHRMGGYVFILLGILTGITAFFNNQAAFFVMFGGLIFGTAAIFVYSYIIYKKIAG